LHPLFEIEHSWKERAFAFTNLYEGKMQFGLAGINNLTIFASAL
jgi:hypothetical protein